ncbi:MAG: hypothetical protein KAG56_04500, partial [Sulfurovaceae bacterium]|nr:hypothetical protein [Sulfurovaceae bacterium]
MTIETLKYINEQWQIEENNIQGKNANIVFIFGESESIKNRNIFESIQQLYPMADIIGCSSSGNILGDELTSDSLIAQAVSFEHGFVEI